MTLLEMSVSAGLLIVIIFIIRSLTIHSFPKITFVILWGIGLIRLFIPFSLWSPFHNFPLAEKITDNLSRLSFQPVVITTSTPIIQLTINSTQHSGSPISINPILVVWLIGFSACALFFLIPHFKSLKEYQAALPIDHPVITQWLREHKSVLPIQIRQLDQISAPVTYGVLRPIILLPKVMDWTNEKQLQFILTHEFIHIKRMDVLWKWLLAAGLCIHWFNPLVWVMYVLANRDIELSCDEAVMLDLGMDLKNAYALVLITMEEKRGIQNLLSNNFSQNAIQERINSIVSFKKASFNGMVAAFTMVILTVSTFATTGPFNIGISKATNDELSVITPTQMPVIIPVQQNSANSTDVTASANSNSTFNSSWGNCGTTANVTAINGEIVSDIEKSFSSPICFEGSVSVKPHINIVIQFGQDMDASTLNGNNIVIFDESNLAGLDFTNISNAFTFTYQPNAKELQIEQVAPFGIDTRKMVQFTLTKNIRTTDGKYFDRQYAFLFTVT